MSDAKPESAKAREIVDAWEVKCLGNKPHTTVSADTKAALIDAIAAALEGACQWKRAAESWKMTTNEAMQRANIMREQLTSIVCRLHRDGGHYIAEHGMDKAIADADEIAARLNAENDTLREQLAEKSAECERLVATVKYIENRHGIELQSSGNRQADLVLKLSEKERENAELKPATLT